MDNTPEFYQAACYYMNNAAPNFTPEKHLSDPKNGDHFVIDDLFNFPNDDTMDEDAGVEAAAIAGNSSSAVDNSSNSSFSAVNAATAEPHFPYQSADFSGSRGSAGGGHFSGELCVPYDDLAELEWLSNFVEESFSSDDMQKLHIIQGMKTRPEQVPGSETHHQYHFQPEASQTGRTLRPEVSVPAKAARSKRSRAARGNWTSRLLSVSPPSANAVSAASSSSESDVAAANQAARSSAVVQSKKKEAPENSGGGEGRRCVHCATDKTPQWRTGPMGPKTLCNACGVRYKSGRLVPEYRPAASPTFVLTKHSNSHRKVVELRRQKEQMRAQQQQFLHQHHHHQHHHHQNMMFDVSNGGDDYLIHQHIAPDFRQMI